MGIILTDRDDDANNFFVNFWHWRTIVESIRALEVLDDETLEGLHLPYCNRYVDGDQARKIASAVEKKLIPQLADDQRLLLDGTVTDVPDDGTFHTGKIESNYSTNAKVLKRFAAYCRSTNGFWIN